jgi:hypothetical protein
MIVLFLIAVAGKVFSFPTVETQALLLSSILLYLRDFVVLMLVVLTLWVLYISEIAGLG